MRSERCGWLMAILVLVLLASPAVQAQEKLRFDIEAQSASTAIQAWAHQSGLQVFAAEEDLRGVRTNEVRGDYTPVQAAQLLIQGTGLEVVAAGDKTVTIRKPNSAPQPANNDESAAAAAADELGEVVVTGSRIKRAGFDTLQAAALTDAAEFERRAYTNVGEALEDTPGFLGSDSSPVSTQPGNQSVGQTFVNLFGLGSQRTLTLVNGRRFVSSNSPVGNRSLAPGSQVDLNVIPAGLVDRVETVAIGGAPVYGSDAIAGTVNVILRDDFEGLQFSALYGDTEDEDAARETYRVLMGGNFADDRGNAVFGFEHNEQRGLVLSDRLAGLGDLRPNPADTGDADGIPATQVVENTQFGILTDGGLPLDNSFAAFGLNLPGVTIPGIYPNGNWIFDTAGNPLHFGADGNLVPFTFGRVVQQALGIPVIMDGGDGLDAARHFALLAPTERTLVNGMAHYDVAPWARAFVEASFAKTEGVEKSELLAFTAPGLLGGPALDFSADNPFLTQQARDVLAANGRTSFQLNRNFNDVLDRRPGTTQIDLYRVVGGFQGDFEAFGDSWEWDVSYNYGRSDNTSSVNYIVEDNLLNAIDAVVDPDSGAIVCASAATNPDCVPINLFGENNFSDAAAAYVSQIGYGRSINRMQVATANLAGRLPFGVSDPVAFNVGAERRKESASFEPDAVQANGVALSGVNLAYEAAGGEFTTEEFYAELVTPLISANQNLPVVKMLEVEGAARHVDHSTAGSDVTWSAGARFAPRLPGWGDGLLLRGVFMHSIRSPAVTELFLNASPILVGIGDVCNAQNFDEGLNPQVRQANCEAALAAVGAAPPGAFDETTDVASAAGTVSGNRDLDNETADSWSIGLVYQPVALPRLRMALDWSNIELEGGIENLGIGAQMAACYDSPDFPNLPACGSFRRLTAAEAAAQPGPTRVAGDVADGFRTGYINTSSIEFAGAILEAAYDFA